MKRNLPALILSCLDWLGVLPSASEAVVVGTAVPLKPSNPNRADMRSVGGVEYDPDKEFAGLENPKYIPFDLSAETTEVPNPDGTTSSMPFEVSAHMYEASKDGKSYRLKRYTSKATLLEAMARGEQFWNDCDAENAFYTLAAPSKLREVTEVGRDEALDHAAEHAFAIGMRRLKESGSFAKLREDYFDNADDTTVFGSDNQGWSSERYGTGRDPDAEYIPLMGGPYNKQLYMYAYLDQHRKAFEAFNHNPIAHQLIKLTTYFTLGRGLDHRCNDNDVDEVWREFVVRTDFYNELKRHADDMWWSGELLFEFYENNPKRGYVDYRSVDPSTIWQPVHDPEDIKKIYYFHQQYQTPWQQYVKNNMQTTRYIIRQIPADRVLFIRLNVSSFELRGRSDLFCNLGWLKRLKDLMNARVIKGQLEAAFVWDVELTSGDADVQNAQLSLPDPYKPGSTFVHNKNVQLKPQSSQIKASEAQPDVNALLGMIATGGGTAKEFLGENSRMGKSGSLISTEPPTKKYEERQVLLESICHAVADRVIACAIKAGRLDADDVLVNARSVTRLAAKTLDYTQRSDAQADMAKSQDEAQAKQEDLQQQQMAQQHEQALAQIKVQGQMGAGPGQDGGAQNGSTNGERRPTKLVSVPNGKTSKMKEAGDPQPTPTNGKATPTDKKPKKKPEHFADLTKEQQRRGKAIKENGKYSAELLEFMFPSIAQEDRSAKLKDLALCEAMEWFPKSMCATMAAKELNITTYDFEEAFAKIVEEAERGMSIAHVYGQDNKHVPETVVAQDVQEEMQAKQPPSAQPLVNTPQPQTVAGFKPMPPQGAAGGKGGPGSVPPGQKPNSGATKVNNHQAPQGAGNPTAPSSGYSAAAKSPFTSEGASKIKSGRESLRDAILRQLLREVLTPVNDVRSRLAQLLLERKVIEELEEGATGSSERERLTV
jgi:hypothetical protein